MKSFPSLLVLCVLVARAGAAETGAAPWKPAAGPLLTRWAREVSPDRAHPEYPRPQMVRREWQNLNGLWQFAVGKEGEAAPLGRALGGRILVPFPVESALSGVMRRAQRVWYRRTFDVPRGWRDRRVLLHFGAADWEATVWVNGRNLGTHRGGYDAFTHDITPALKPAGPQEIVVGVFDPTSGGGQPRGKQVNNPKGIYYTPTTGIWQTVWLEPAPAGGIADLQITPDVDKGAVRVRVDTRGAPGGATVRVAVRDGGREVGRAEGDAASEIEVRVPRPRLWSPARPFLYDLRVSLRQGGRDVDAVDSYFGMRKVALGRVNGITRILLNGQFVFQVGPLDQGFWPDGLYTAPTDDALRWDIEQTKRLGFNMIRKHVKVEPARWYYWADRLGVLVWQDMPSGDNRSAEDRSQFERELRRMVEGRRNHPSVVKWVVFNEGWGQYDTERITRWVKELDPSRLVSNASGWTDKKVGDVIDMHRYPGPGSPAPEPDRAAVLGEFGGLGLPVAGHMWSGQNWGYRGMTDPEQLTRAYENLFRRVWQLRDAPGLSAVVYTQTTDVETEANGLFTYDRAVLKMDAGRVTAANTGRLPVVERKMLAPSAQEEAVSWRYALEKPADGWTLPGFDDSAWRTGPAGFGSEKTPGARVRTVWNTPDIWLRREFVLPDARVKNLAFWAHHDEDVEIYLNGVLAAKATRFTTDYEELPLTAEGRAALRPGRNVLAVHCRQTGGGQYIDVGLAQITVKPKAR